MRRPNRREGPQPIGGAIGVAFRSATKEPAGRSSAALPGRTTSGCCQTSANVVLGGRETAYVNRRSAGPRQSAGALGTAPPPTRSPWFKGTRWGFAARRTRRGRTYGRRRLPRSPAGRLPGESGFGAAGHTRPGNAGRPWAVKERDQGPGQVGATSGLRLVAGKMGRPGPAVAAHFRSTGRPVAARSKATLSWFIRSRRRRCAILASRSSSAR